MLEERSELHFKLLVIDLPFKVLVTLSHTGKNFD